MKAKISLTLLLLLLVSTTLIWAFAPPPGQTDEMLPGSYQVDWDFPEPPKSGFLEMTTSESGQYGEEGGHGLPLPIQLFEDSKATPPVKRYNVMDPNNPDDVLYHMYVREVPNSNPLQYEIWWCDTAGIVVRHGFASQIL